jgi:hypothetical protein
LHLCYVDEAGSTGKNLTDREQLIFAMAGLRVSDEKWRKTEEEIGRVIARAYEGSLPSDFELHSYELLARYGKGPFVGWESDRRSRLALDLLRLVDERSHQVLVQLVNKDRMSATKPPAENLGFDWKDPWEVAFSPWPKSFSEAGELVGRALGWW